MQEKIKKFFDNDKLFYVMPWIFLATSFVYDGYELFADKDMEGLYYIFTDLFTFAGLLGITISFKKHEKNIMKGLLGGILFLKLSNIVSNASYDLIVDRSDIVYGLFALVLAILYIALAINHLRLASDHSAKPSTVKFNQYLVLAIWVFDVAWEAYVFISEDYSIVYSIALEMSLFALLYTIVAVETKVDMFKAFRQENAGK